jgi:hypothetical protein
MSATTFLLKGKYSGSTFEEILNKDLNYCLFLIDIKYPSEEIKTFVNWLTSINQTNNKAYIDNAIDIRFEKQVERMNKLHTRK